ncbi:MAG: cytochrome c, partial [Pseudobdellovibrionaceae bacterium]|nr:cytochrome c [Pseudobdellovibrionaceae bacterium]
RGAKLYNAKGCVACHSTDGSVKVGPTWKALWAKVDHEMANGEKLVVDEAYVREAILLPNAKIVKGFVQGVMPTYQGQLSEEELMSLIEFIKTLK